MSFIADSHNNPLFVDDETLPPQRSAFAVLGVDRDELRTLGLKAAYDRARKAFLADSNLAGVYGRSLHEDDLRIALTRLENPRDRVINELLDFRHEAYQIQDTPELTEVLEAFRLALACEDAPRLEDPSLIARILESRLSRASTFEAEMVETSAPALPSVEELLADPS